MMGPVTTFDKSFLESLSLNESVWLDNFYSTNICHTFYVETLGDLYKGVTRGVVARSGSEIVKETVKKTPIIESCPNVHHQHLLLSDLMGYKVETEHHRPIITGGKYKKSPDGSISIDFGQFPEASALERWRVGDFLTVEREAAGYWRQILLNIDSNRQVELVKNLLKDNDKLSSLDDCLKIAERSITARHHQFIYFALDLLNIPSKYYQGIIKKWRESRPTSFNLFAPYAAYILKVNIVFLLGLSKGLLSQSHKGKQTNIIDLSYLYYLPFCQIFISSDNFHKRITELFLEKDQVFVWGPDMKSDLKKINEYYSKFSQEEKDKGLFSLAPYPPEDIETLTGQLFDKLLRPWRGKKLDLPKDDGFVRKMKKIREKQTNYDGPQISSDDVDSMTITKMVLTQRGDWRILPKGIEDKKKTSK